MFVFLNVCFVWAVIMLSSLFCSGHLLDRAIKGSALGFFDDGFKTEIRLVNGTFFIIVVCGLVSFTDGLISLPLIIGGIAVSGGMTLFFHSVINFVVSHGPSEVRNNLDLTFAGGTCEMNNGRVVSDD